MAIQTNMSIVSFLKELKTRIELLSSNKITENINNSNIDKINDILSHYNISPNKEISFYEISLISEEDIVSLLSLVGQTANSIKYILNELDEYYERIAAIINKYIRDFISIGATQTQMLNDKITLYKKYIDLFEQDNFKEPFSDINEISRALNTSLIDFALSFRKSAMQRKSGTTFLRSHISSTFRDASFCSRLEERMWFR